MLFVAWTRVLSRISDVMTLCGHSVTICHLSSLAPNALCSAHYGFYFISFQKENHKINVAITAFRSGKKKAFCCCKLFMFS